jgi:hypothetical protein
MSVETSSENLGGSWVLAALLIVSGWLNLERNIVYIKPIIHTTISIALE